MSLIKGKNIDVSKVGFSAPKMLDNGAKLVYVNYNDGRFSVQTPWMSMPWKMGAFTEGEYPKYSIDLSFRGMDENPDMKGFHDKFKELEDAIIDGGVKNCASWLKKDPSKTSKDVIDALFNPIIKVSKNKETGIPDGKWPPLMKVKVPRRDGTWEFKLVDKDGTAYKINDSETPDEVEEIFVKNSKVRCIIQCVGLWIASGNYMCQWKLTKAEVEVPKTYSNEDFLADSDDEETGQVTKLEDSDDGSDDGDGDGDDDDGNDDDGEDDGVDDGVNSPTPDPEPEPEPEPEPKEAPKPKKKKVVKKVIKKKDANA